MFNKPSVKELVFTILSKEYPLKIIELKNYISKRYGHSVTFQAVRRVLLDYEKQGVVTKTNSEYTINLDWVKKELHNLEELEQQLEMHKKNVKYEPAQDGTKTFTFDTLHKMIIFWEKIQQEWYNSFKKGDDNINCWEGCHLWESLSHLKEEKKLFVHSQKLGIQSYVITANNTPLDRNAATFYQDMGLQVKTRRFSTEYEKEHYVGTYGDIVVQAKYTKEMAKTLDEFFKKQTLQKISLSELADITNMKTEVKLTVIKNKLVAKKINESIINEFKNRNKRVS